MRLYGLELATVASFLAVLAVPAVAFAQGQSEDLDPVGVGAQGNELDDDDLLDPDLGGTPKSLAVRSNLAVPPVADKMRLDDESAAIGRSADEVADELKELLRQYQVNPKAANSEIARRLKEAESRLSSLQARVESLEIDLEKKEGRLRARRRKRGSYGTAIEVGRRVRRDKSSHPGEQQFDWWHGLARKALAGLPKGLQYLGQKRTNALKARADALAMSTSRRHRPYANVVVRKAVGASRLGQPVQDRRMSDLFLGGGNQTHDSLRPSRREPKVDFDTREPVVLLPRVRDPVTGRTRVVVDLPLGEPFTPAKAGD